MKYISLWAFTAILFFSLNLSGQGRKGPSMKNKLHHLKSILDLSPEQEEELEKVFENSKEEFKSIKSNKDLSREQKYEQVKEIRESTKSAVESILSDEQIAQLQSAKGERHENRKEARNELKQYHESEVLPKLRELRADFDSELSNEDKATIDAIREDHKTFSNKMEALKDKVDNEELEREEAFEQMKELKEGFADNHETMVELAKKYEDPLKALHEDNEELFEEINMGRRNIMKKYGPEDRQMKGKHKSDRKDKKRKDQKLNKKDRKDKKGKFNKRGKHQGPEMRHQEHGKEMGERGKYHKAVSFLLIDPQG